MSEPSFCRVMPKPRFRIVAAVPEVHGASVDERAGLRPTASASKPQVGSQNSTSMNNTDMAKHVDGREKPAVSAAVDFLRGGIPADTWSHNLRLPHPPFVTPPSLPLKLAHFPVSPTPLFAPSTLGLLLPPKVRCGDHLRLY